MTKREFLQAVIVDTQNEEIRTFAQEEIIKMDMRNESRHNRPSKTALENEPIKAKIVELLTEEYQTASEIAVQLEISTQKSSALCRQLVEEGRAEVAEIKVPKKGKQKGYKVVAVA